MRSGRLITAVGVLSFVVGAGIGYVLADDASEVDRLQSANSELIAASTSSQETIQSLEAQVEDLSFEVENATPLEVTPESCVQALDLAQDLTNLVTDDLLPIPGKLIDLLQDAYVAGLAQGGLGSVLGPARAITADFSRVSDEAISIFKRVKPLSRECRSLAE